MMAEPRYPADHHWTIEDYMSLDDDQRGDILGEERVTTPTPRDIHQSVSNNRSNLTQLGAELAVHVRDHLDEASGHYILESSFGDDETFEIDCFPDFELDLETVWPPDRSESN